MVNRKPDPNTWPPPEDWSDFTPEEQEEWKRLAVIFNDMYWDFYEKGVLSISFGKYATPEEHEANENFMEILRHQNKIQNAANMWINLSMNVGAEKFSKRNQEIDPESFAYTYLIIFTGSILQSVELFRNAIIKTINHDTITTKRGKKITNLGNKGISGILDALNHYSTRVKDIKELIEMGNDMRTAYAHGVWWFKDGNIILVKNVMESDMTPITLEQIFKEVRIQSLLTQCFIWTIVNLISEGLFKPI